MHHLFLVASVGTASTDVPLWLTAPFGLLLLLIATMPLSPPWIKQYWDRFYPQASLGLGAVVAGYYLIKLPLGGSVIGHTAHEYFSFICLVGSLFVVSGGIHIKVRGKATPFNNVLFLAIAALGANVIGTTGASMVFVRPWIRMNKIRISPYHVVFFIFVVSNVGGALTPVGDPPLFLGFLSGVPFFWLIGHVMPQWILTLGLILGAFYVMDRRGFRHMPERMQHEMESYGEKWRFDGMINLLFLFAIVGAVFIPDSVARYGVRELVMIVASIASYFLTPKVAHLENAFSFGPIKEVAFLFAGIFATMMPCLGYLGQHGQELGFKKPMGYYLASGALSSVLDNAPTYVNFLALAESTAKAEDPPAFTASDGDEHATVNVLLEKKPLFVIAVSLGSVFFGAMTYIGNGPNFMVKSIAHESGVHCPTFFGYIWHYSLPILLPILAIAGWLCL